MRVPVLLLLVAITGCARKGGAADSLPAPRASAERAEEKGRPSMIVVRNQKTVEAVLGEWIDLVVTRPVAVPFEHQFEWPATPTIDGDAIRFRNLRIEAPPADADGGVTTHHYELEAVAPGPARVTLVPKAASPQARPSEVVLDVTVVARRTAAPQPSPALPELIRRTVEVIATSADSPLGIAKAFGEIESDAAGAVYVKPSDPRLKRVLVGKNPRLGGTNDVQLQLAVPGSLTVAEIEALWGAPQHPPALSLETRTVIFRPPLPAGAAFLPTVTLTLDGDESGPVHWIGVVRDPLPLRPQEP